MNKIRRLLALVALCASLFGFGAVVGGTAAEAAAKPCYPNCPW